MEFCLIFSEQITTILKCFAVLRYPVHGMLTKFSQGCSRKLLHSDHISMAFRSVTANDNRVTEESNTRRVEVAGDQNIEDMPQHDPTRPALP